jgi:carbon-monoxide dehydrogenase medium subunit
VGSLAWGHPCAEWCALAVLLDAELEVRSVTGTRRVPAGSWFRGDRRTDRRPDELVTAVHLPLLPRRSGTGFVEHRRSHASFALVAALATLELDDDGIVRQARVALAGAADVPLRAESAEELLVGRPPDDDAIREASAAAAAASDPVDEPHCSVGYRRHAVGVVTARALRAAVQDIALAQVAA